MLYRSFGLDDSSFGYIDSQEAKIRREILHPLFSRRSIIELEPFMQLKVLLHFGPASAQDRDDARLLNAIMQVDKLISRLAEYPGRPVNITRGLRSATVDIITDYCFAYSIGALDAENFQHDFIVSVEESQTYFWWLKYFPFLLPMAMATPRSIAKHFGSFYRGFVVLRDDLATQIDSYLADPSSIEQAEHETVYHHLIKPQNFKSRHERPSRYSLIQEAMTLIQAGSETVAHTCSVGMFHVLNNPSVLAKLVKGLRESWPDEDVPMPLIKLEKLPYLVCPFSFGKLMISSHLLPSRPRS